MRFSLVTLFVDDPFTVADWYREHLGLSEAHRTDRFVRLADKSRKPCLALHVGAPVQRAEHVQLHFEVDDVDADHRRLAAEGVAVSSPPTDRLFVWGAGVACDELQMRLELGPAREAELAGDHQLRIGTREGVQLR